MDPVFGHDDPAQILEQASQALRKKDLTRARRLAYLAASLDPTSELSWLILAASASPHASVFYLEKALELNPDSKTAKKGLQWAVDRLSGLNQPPVIPPVISLPQESCAEITQQVAVQQKPQIQAFQLHRWVKKAISLASGFRSSTFQRVAKYTGVRLLTMSLMIVTSIFLIIYIANLGGYLDTIQKALIDENINGMLMTGWLRDVSPEERSAVIEQTRLAMQKSYGLDQPYFARVMDWFYRGLSFDWGQSRLTYPISSTIVEGSHSRPIESNDIRTLIVAYLPRTLLLLGTSNLGIFLISILIALPLSRKPHTKMNQAIRLLSLISSVPSWVFGVILLMFLYLVVGNFKFSLGFSDWPTNFTWETFVRILQGLSLPFLAIFLSKFFQSVYAWRVYFTNYSKEDYIDLARAKGLPDNILERRYLLRPALPSIITSFALIMISIWQECIIVESFFNVGGIGGLFVWALNSNDPKIVVALVATFAYFLAVTILILDVAYAIVDPRVRVGEETQSGNPLLEKRRLGLRSIFKPRWSPAGGQRISKGFLLPQFAHVQKALSLLVGQLKSIFHSIPGWWHSFIETAREIMRFPTAVAGLVIIAVLGAIAIFTVLSIPFSRAISLWRGDDKAWIRNPKKVPPEWTNAFRSDKLPVTIDLTSRDSTASKVASLNSNGTSSVSILLPFEYTNGHFPQDILVLFDTKIKEKKPFVLMSWITPDGREIPLKNFAPSDESFNLFSSDTDLKNKFGRVQPAEALFARPGSEPAEVLQGKYQLKVTGILFEEDSQLDAELVVYGQVFGIAGTDLERRDLSLILSWGLVVALAFGIIAAIGTTISSVVLAAAGAWFGGWVDGLIHRVSEVFMVLPVLPTSIMIFVLYSKSIWVILGVTVGLNIFGNSLKNYRAMFLQVITSPYIEAACTYGASGWRIIFQYMIPRIRSVLIPQLIILVPGYVFFESTLSYLGVSDPFTPTLGKLLTTTLGNGIFREPAYLTLEPFGLLLLICLGFAFFGFALERYFNEKLGI